MWAMDQQQQQRIVRVVFVVAEILPRLFRFSSNAEHCALEDVCASKGTEGLHRAPNV